MTSPDLEAKPASLDGSANALLELMCRQSDTWSTPVVLVSPFHRATPLDLAALLDAFVAVCHAVAALPYRKVSALL